MLVEIKMVLLSLLGCLVHAVNFKAFYCTIVYSLLEVPQHEIAWLWKI